MAREARGPKDSHFHSSDEESKENQHLYEQMCASIGKALDPSTNTVLVVDDERGIRKFVSRHIRRQDPTLMVVEAENGQDGLVKLEEIRDKFNRDPVLIITDLNMPVMDGWQFIAELKKDYVTAGLSEGIPVIVLSSTSGEKGLAFFRKSVHKGKSGYEPLAAVAKEVCLEPTKYDAVGEKGLLAWLRHFMKTVPPE